MNAGRAAARVLAWALAIVSLSLIVASCRDIVAGEATNFPTELCAILDDCEGGCADDLLARVENASPEERKSLLAYDVETDCLASCVGARSCRDQPPICHPTGEACVESYDCCGFTIGASRCEEDATESAGNKCCLALGAVCEPNTDSCCDGELCPDNARCGGVECTLTIDEVAEPGDAACTASSECCSERCEGGQCVANTCSAPGDACAVEADCCPQTSTNGETILPICNENGKCANPNTTSCDICVPGDASVDCCRDDGKVCYQLLDGTQCADPSCTPLGAICTADVECCPASDQPAFCNANGAIPRCDPEPTCVTEGGTCVGDAECCSGGACLAGFCRACVATGNHSPCVQGLPLATDTDARVEQVCGELPTCCCKGWSLVCVTAYKNKGALCPING